MGEALTTMLFKLSFGGFAVGSFGENGNNIFALGRDAKHFDVNRGFDVELIHKRVL